MCAAASRARGWPVLASPRSRDSAAATGLCCSLPRARRSRDRSCGGPVIASPPQLWVCAAASRRAVAEEPKRMAVLSRPAASRSFQRPGRAIFFQGLAKQQMAALKAGQCPFHQSRWLFIKAGQPQWPFYQQWPLYVRGRDGRFINQKPNGQI